MNDQCLALVFYFLPFAHTDSYGQGNFFLADNNFLPLAHFCDFTRQLLDSCFVIDYFVVEYSSYFLLNEEEKRK